MPAETAIASCGDIVEGLIFPDWRQLWDDKIAAGIEPDRALDWVKESRELSEIISFSKLEDRAPLERSYAMIHLQHPEWGPEQITYHYKIWEKSCGL